MKAVQVMSIEGYKAMLENYEILFCSMLPQINVKCKETYCTINGLKVVYKDIVNMAVEDNKCFILNINNSTYVYLPLDTSIKYRVENVNLENS